MELSTRDNLVIAFTLVNDYMKHLDENRAIAPEYKDRVFSNLFVYLQSQYFPTMNPKEVQTFIELADARAMEMKTRLTQRILEVAKPQNGGIGIDKGLEPTESLDELSPQEPSNVNVEELVSQIFEFHKKARYGMSKEEFVRLVTNQSMKIYGLKEKPREEIEKVVIKLYDEETSPKESSKKEE